MKNFRQKEFVKKALKKSLIYLKDHPILPISTASLGIGIANYNTNTNRLKESKKQHQEQMETFKSLNNNIIENSKALNIVNQSLQKTGRNLETLKKAEKEDNPKKKNRGLLTLFKRKNYSIESGGFKGRKIEPSPSSISTGALIGGSVGAITGAVIGNNISSNMGIISLVGAGVGAGLGALVTWLNNVAEKSIFNSGLSNRANSYTLCRYLENRYMRPEITEEETETSDHMVGNTKITNTRKIVKSKRNLTSPIGTLYNIDSDPNKHVVNILLRGNIMVMLINKPTNFEMRKLNIVLDNYCKSYKLADYTSEKIGKDIYIVEINIVQSTEGSLVIKFIDSGFKVNILTTDRFGIKNR